MSDSTPAPEATPEVESDMTRRLREIQEELDKRDKNKVKFKKWLGYVGIAVAVVILALAPVVVMMNRGSDGGDELKAQIAAFQSAEKARVEKETKEAEEAKAKAEAEKAELAKSELEAAKKAAEEAKLAAEKAIKEVQEANAAELAKLREELASKLATPTPAPAQATPAPAVNTVNRSFTAEEFLAIYGSPGTPPKIVVASELEIPKGDILVHSLKDVGSGEFVANQETGRDITVDNVPGDIGTEVPIEYFTFAPAALEIYKANNGLKAVITNFETEPGRLLVVFKRRG